MSEVVYFFEAEGLGRVKIGRSRNHWTRQAQLAPGSPAPLRLLGTIPGGCHRETELHHRFAEHRVHGEWFALTDDLRSEIEKMIRDHEESARAQTPPEDPRRAFPISPWSIDLARDLQDMLLGSPANDEGPYPTAEECADMAMAGMVGWSEAWQGEVPYPRGVIGDPPEPPGPDFAFTLTTETLKAAVKAIYCRGPMRAVHPRVAAELGLRWWELFREELNVADIPGVACLWAMMILDGRLSAKLAPYELLPPWHSCPWSRPRISYRHDLASVEVDRIAAQAEARLARMAESPPPARGKPKEPR